MESEQAAGFRSLDGEKSDTIDPAQLQTDPDTQSIESTPLPDFQNFLASLQHNEEDDSNILKGVELAAQTLSQNATSDPAAETDPYPISEMTPVPKLRKSTLNAVEQTPTTQKKGNKATPSTAEQQTKEDSKKQADLNYRPKRQYKQLIDVITKYRDHFSEGGSKMKKWSGDTHPENEELVNLVSNIHTLRSKLKREDELFSEYHSAVHNTIDSFLNHQDVNKADKQILKLMTSRPFDESEVEEKPKKTTKKQKTGSSKKIITFDSEDDTPLRKRKQVTSSSTPTPMPKLTDNSKKAALQKKVNTIFKRAQEDVNDLIDEYFQ